MAIGKFTDRTGESKLNNDGDKMTIIAYRNAKDMDILFNYTGNIREHVDYHNFDKGKLRDWDKVRIVCNIGKIKGKIEKEDRKIYKTWKNMLNRCYNDDFKRKHPTYTDCYVCEEWHYFDNFKQWYYENYYEIEGSIMDLDKDILIKGNKVYSPETCIFVPHEINSLFLKNDNKRGNLPLGVSLHKSSGLYGARGKVYGKGYVSAGYYKTIEEAFDAYKQQKESNIKEVADLYKDKIPQKLYKAMYSYEVEITD